MFITNPADILGDPSWRHQTETFSALLAICAGYSPVTSEFPAQRPMTRSFDVFLDLRLNKRLSKQSWFWWFEKPWRPLCRHCNSTGTLPTTETWVIRSSPGFKWYSFYHLCGCERNDVIQRVSKIPRNLTILGVETHETAQIVHHFTTNKHTI